VNTPLIVTSVIVGVAVVIGFVSRGRGTMDLESWTVAGRGFGSLLLWLLLAGEIYTTFTFLGAAGYAYGEGGPVFYILGYGALAYIVSFFLLPPLWSYAKRHGLVTQADYFTHRFGNRWLGALAAVVGVVFVVPYADQQLQGLGLIVQSVTKGQVTATESMIVAFALVALFVFASGLRATAWTAVLKDALLIIVVLIIGIGLPLKYFGSYSGVVHAVNLAHPGHLAVPGSSASLGVAWLISTLILTSLGFYMYPQAFMVVYSAKSGRAIRRNATVLPLYQILLLLMFYVGFTALLVVPGLKGTQTNSALLRLVAKAEPSWLVGLVGGAGALAAIVPASVIVLAAATLLARNVYQGLIRPQATPSEVLRLSRFLVLIVMAIALWLAIVSPAILVNLLLVAYDGVTQFFPAIALSLFWRRLSTLGAGAGIIVGVGLALTLVLDHHDPLWGLNAGILALAANVIVTVVVSLLTPRWSLANQRPDTPKPAPLAADPAGSDA
jgi:SSS family solute:Na+ symporter